MAYGQVAVAPPPRSEFWTFGVLEVIVMVEEGNLVRMLCMDEVEGGSVNTVDNNYVVKDLKDIVVVVVVVVWHIVIGRDLEVKTMEDLFWSPYCSFDL